MKFRIIPIGYGASSPQSIRSQYSQDGVEVARRTAAGPEVAPLAVAACCRSFRAEVTSTSG